MQKKGRTNLTTASLALFANRKKKTAVDLQNRKFSGKVKISFTFCFVVLPYDNYGRGEVVQFLH